MDDFCIGQAWRSNVNWLVLCGELIVAKDML